MRGGEKKEIITKIKNLARFAFFCLGVTITAAVLVFKCVFSPTLLFQSNKFKPDATVVIALNFFHFYVLVSTMNSCWDKWHFYSNDY